MPLVTSCGNATFGGKLTRVVILMTLRELRERVGLTQEQLAAKAGLTHSTIYKLELRMWSHGKNGVNRTNYGERSDEAKGKRNSQKQGGLEPTMRFELMTSFLPGGGTSEGLWGSTSWLEIQRRMPPNHDPEPPDRDNGLVVHGKSVDGCPTDGRPSPNDGAVLQPLKVVGPPVPARIEEGNGLAGQRIDRLDPTRLVAVADRAG